MQNDYSLSLSSAGVIASAFKTNAKGNELFKEHIQRFSESQQQSAELNSESETHRENALESYRKIENNVQLEKKDSEKQTDSKLEQKTLDKTQQIVADGFSHRAKPNLLQSATFSSAEQNLAPVSQNVPPIQPTSQFGTTTISQTNGEPKQSAVLSQTANLQQSERIASTISAQNVFGLTFGQSAASAELSGIITMPNLSRGVVAESILFSGVPLVASAMSSKKSSTQDDDTDDENADSETEFDSEKSEDSLPFEKAIETSVPPTQLSDLQSAEPDNSPIEIAELKMQTQEPEKEEPEEPFTVQTDGSPESFDLLKSPDRGKFVRRVISAFQSLDGDNGIIRMKLAPEALGSLSMFIEIKDRKMYARIQTETEEAKSILLEHLEELKNGLLVLGFEIASFDVESA